MIFLICCLIGLIVGIVLVYRDWGWDIDMLLYGFVGTLAGLAVALMLWLGVGCFIPGCEPITVNSSSTEIHALADNTRYSSTVSGSVFLIQRYTNEKLEYSYMYFIEGKGYGFNEVDAKQSYINYTDKTPYVRCDYIDYKNAFCRWLFPDIYEDEYIFFLPEDAEVIDDFIVDFE